MLILFTVNFEHWTVIIVFIKGQLIICLKLSLFRVQNMLKLLIQPVYFVVSFFSKMGTNCVQNRDNGHFREVRRDCLIDKPHSRF